MSLDLICECSHRSSGHIHGPDGGGCKSSCGCLRFRLAVRPGPEAVQDETSAARERSSERR